MKEQVLSIEQMRHLQELGVDTSKASMVAVLYSDNDEEVKWEEAEKYATPNGMIAINILNASTGKYNHSHRKDWGVFTLQDMLEMMPNEVKGFDLVLFMDNHIQYEKWDGIRQAKILVQFDGKSLLEVAYNMLCWLAENKLLGKEEKR